MDTTLPPTELVTNSNFSIHLNRLANLLASSLNITTAKAQHHIAVVCGTRSWSRLTRLVAKPADPSLEATELSDENLNFIFRLVKQFGAYLQLEGDTDFQDACYDLFFDGEDRDSQLVSRFNELDILYRQQMGFSPNKLANKLSLHWTLTAAGQEWCWRWICRELHCKKTKAEALLQWFWDDAEFATRLVRLKIYGIDKEAYDWHEDEAFFDYVCSQEEPLRKVFIKLQNIRRLLGETLGEWLFLPNTELAGERPFDALWHPRYDWFWQKWAKKTLAHDRRVRMAQLVDWYRSKIDLFPENIQERLADRDKALAKGEALMKLISAEMHKRAELVEQIAGRSLSFRCYPESFLGSICAEDLRLLHRGLESLTVTTFGPSVFERKRRIKH